MQPSLQQRDQVSDQESFAIVKIFLNAATACIAHSRELIPWVSSCFQTRYVSQIQAKSDKLCDMYKDFCRMPIMRNDGTQEFRILLRGHDARADSILNFIEGGITEALEQNYLKAFRFFVAKDVTDPASVLETYTFSFLYKNCRVSEISIASKDAGPFIVKNLHHSFSACIRTLLRTLRDLPRLPRRRSLGVSLLYNDNCPEDYQPIGFTDVRQHSQVHSRGSWSDLWQMIPAHVADLQSGSWEVKFGAQSLQYTDDTSTSRLLDVNISAQIRQLQKTSSQNPEIASTAIVLPSTLADGSRADSPGDGKVCTDTISMPKQSQSNAKASITQSQSSKGSVNKLAKLSVASKNRRRRNVVTGKLAELIVQARALENTYYGTAKLFDSAQLENGKIRRLHRAGDVNCECGSPEVNAQMLLCELCGTKQHKICYGYESLRQTCLPEEHFCYNCLLLPRETKANESLPEIVRMRLALHYIASQPTGEVEVGPDFMRFIFGPGTDATEEFLRVIERLTQEGFISRHEDGFAHILHDNDLLLRAQSAYLDPLAVIVHHYQIVRDGDTPERRKREVLSALKLYLGGRPSSTADDTNSFYDRVHVRDNAGREAVRWGIYASWKRKRVDTPEASPRQQKMSIANDFVTINRSTPSDAMSIDNALHEAASEAEWDLRVNSRLRSSSTNVSSTAG